MRNLALAAIAATCLVSCEEDGLYQSRSSPDAGDPIEVPDAGAGLPIPAVDAGLADTGVVPEPPPADEPVYIHTGDTLYAYAPDTNVAVEIGPFVGPSGPLGADMVDIAIDKAGRMFGGTHLPGREQANEVYQIDPTSGRCTLQFRFDDTLNGMTFLPTGELVVAGARITLVDPSDGHVLRELVREGGAYETSGDIVALPDGFLYWTVRGVRRGRESGTDRVVRIDPRTGETFVLGDAHADHLFGLGYAGGSLYGFSSSGLVVVLDPTTGEVLRQNRLSGRWFGATTNPVLW